MQEPNAYKPKKFKIKSPPCLLLRSSPIFRQLSGRFSSRLAGTNLSFSPICRVQLCINQKSYKPSCREGDGAGYFFWTHKTPHYRGYGAKSQPQNTSLQGVLWFVIFAELILRL
ncbi:hypothetical protein Hanom_Chr14g01290591 [Helianthus anomalus]